MNMQERFARRELRADKKRALVASVIERAAIKKLTDADFAASLRQVPPGLVVQCWTRARSPSLSGDRSRRNWTGRGYPPRSMLARRSQAPLWAAAAPRLP